MVERPPSAASSLPAASQSAFSAVTGTAMFSRREPLLPPAAAEEQRFPWEPASED